MKRSRKRKSFPDVVAFEHSSEEPGFQSHLLVLAPVPAAARVAAVRRLGRAERRVRAGLRSIDLRTRKHRP